MWCNDGCTVSSAPIFSDLPLPLMHFNTLWLQSDELLMLYVSEKCNSGTKKIVKLCNFIFRGKCMYFFFAVNCVIIKKKLNFFCGKCV